MTKEQIEQAAKERKWRIAVWRGIFGTRHAETDFIAGALYRQPKIDALISEVEGLKATLDIEINKTQSALVAEIDRLKADIERYRQDIAEGKKREEIARKVIEEKRKENKNLNQAPS